MQSMVAPEASRGWRSRPQLNIRRLCAKVLDMWTRAEYLRFPEGGAAQGCCDLRRVDDRCRGTTLVHPTPNVSNAAYDKVTQQESAELRKSGVIHGCRSRKMSTVR